MARNKLHFSICQIGTQTAGSKRRKTQRTEGIFSVLCVEKPDFGSTLLAAHDAASLTAWLTRQHDDCDVSVSLFEGAAAAA